MIFMTPLIKYNLRFERGSAKVRTRSAVGELQKKFADSDARLKRLGDHVQVGRKFDLRKSGYQQRDPNRRRLRERIQCYLPSKPTRDPIFLYTSPSSHTATRSSACCGVCASLRKSICLRTCTKSLKWTQILTTARQRC